MKQYKTILILVTLFIISSINVFADFNNATAWWNLYGGNDTSGNGYNLQQQGTPIFSDMKIDKGLQYETRNNANYLNISNANFNKTTDFTIFALFQLKDNSTQSEFFGTYNTPDNGLLWYYNGNLQLYAGGTCNINDGRKAKNNVWYWWVGFNIYWYYVCIYVYTQLTFVSYGKNKFCIL